MLLYHGTSERHLAAIQRGGLRPRGRRKGNWAQDVVSCPTAVYLTNAYAVFYAQQASKDGRLLILEINTNRLNPFLLTPDEDFLEQATRDQSVFDTDGDALEKGLNMVQRTKWFRKRLLHFRDHWSTSLDHLGNCCYHCVIAPEAITRYALLPINSPFSLMTDPTMTLLNYKIMGGYYRELTKRVFGGEVNLTVGFPDYMQRLAAASRDSIQIFDFERSLV